jgi:hypothetical protein
MKLFLRCLIAFSLLGVPVFAQSSASAHQDDVKQIQQIEDDWLNAERTTNIEVLERIMADDYVSLNSGAMGPGKVQLLQGLRPKAGQAPPYSVDTQDMHIYILDNVAVAAYTKTYVAKENGNVGREDNTHIFKKDHGVWKLKISRGTVRSSD